MSSPTPAPARTSNRPFAAAELRRFVRELARTGNLTAAAAAIGRPRRSLQARRARDPRFDAQCAAALRAFDAGVPPDGYRVGEARGGQRQLRRAAPSHLTADELTRYLDCLAVSGNLALAARSIGRTRRALLRHRHRNAAFAAAEAKAVESGIKLLEGELVHSALAALGEHGECEWLDDDEPLPEPAFPDMTANDALLLLFRYWRRQERRDAARERPAPPVRPVSPPPPPPKMQIASDEEVIAALQIRIETFKQELEREREQEERAAAPAAVRTSPGDEVR